MTPRKRWQQARSPLNLTARQRIAAAVQRVERPIVRRVEKPRGATVEEIRAHDDAGAPCFYCRRTNGACRCGERGPCAPPTVAVDLWTGKPAPVPAPVGAQFKMGDRVRVSAKAENVDERARGQQATVVDPASVYGLSPVRVLVRLDSGHDIACAPADSRAAMLKGCQRVDPDDLEPASPLPVEPEAWVPPSPWRETAVNTTRPSQARRWSRGYSVIALLKSGEWATYGDTDDEIHHVSGRAALEYLEAHARRGAGA